MTFFADIFGDAEGYATIVLANSAGRPVDERWYTYPQDINEMEALVAAHPSKDVWYSPILFSERRRLKDNAKSTHVLAADADACEPENFRVVPSIVIESSPERYQVYWILDQAVDPHQAARINRRISQTHKHEGCDIAFVNAAKLMRVPETSNSKHPGARVILAEQYDSVYDMEYFDDVYPASEIPDIVEYESETLPDGMEAFVTERRNSVDLMNGLPNAAGLKSLLLDNWVQDKRSDMRFKLLLELYRLDLPDQAVMALAWWAPSNKYRDDDPRGVVGLWNEAVKAKHIVADEIDGTVWTPSDGEQDYGTTMAEPTVIKTDFLTPEERETLTTTFVEEWIAWAATKTDAPGEFHRAAAITILSAVYSEFGHVFPSFGETKLNIWHMVLGRSTKDRKSTSRAYMAKAFRALKTEDYDYELGDDGTPGGITLALHDRPHKASVYARDEAQGLFKELLGQSYMVGGAETFTKLYDGWSGGRIRASGEKKILASVPVSFIMFLMGILTESAEVLTVTNYRSGFLTRFVYVIGSRPEGYEAPPLEQGTEGGTGEDAVFNGMINHLIQNRAWWELNKPETDGASQRMYADEDAWLRFQQFMKAANDKAEKSQYSEIIGTTTERMQITVLKLAALFAMDERQKRIRLRHMLQAIDFAGAWFDDAATVASMVGSSEWEKDVDALEKFLRERGGETPYAVAYREFKSKKAFEFDEMVLALERRGAIRRIPVGSKWTLEIETKE